MRNAGRLLGLAAIVGTLGLGGCMSIQMGPRNDLSLYPTSPSCSGFQYRASRTAPLFGRMQQVSAVQQRMMMGNNAQAIRFANAKKLASGECF